MDDRPHIFELTPDALREYFAAWGLKPFRATQVLEWVYQQQVGDVRLMTNLPQGDRELLAEKLHITSGRAIAHQMATDGVQKLLIDWALENDLPSDDPEHVALPHSQTGGGSKTQTECVMIPVEQRRTACISSQIGCPVGCRFCASGLGGLDGNLSTGRIVEQVWRLGRLKGVGRISNVVFMGMGEPLANFERVTAALEFICSDWGLGISARRVTISTVGLPAQIRRLADQQWPITLALSLHAPNDELRRKLIPWADYVTIEQLLSACRYYFNATGREITLEYTLMRGTNDRIEHARELATLATKLRSNVNLIRYNEVGGLPFGRPETDDVHAFQQVLREAGINTHIRASRGRDIAAACGQLRHEAAAT
jgi:23S rRNA (adenine2503-C2)-methyltransferase